MIHSKFDFPSFGWQEISPKSPTKIFFRSDRDIRKISGSEIIKSQVKWNSFFRHEARDENSEDQQWGSRASRVSIDLRPFAWTKAGDSEIPFVLALALTCDIPIVPICWTQNIDSATTDSTNHSTSRLVPLPIFSWLKPRLSWTKDILKPEALGNLEHVKCAITYLPRDFKCQFWSFLTNSWVWSLKCHFGCAFVCIHCHLVFTRTGENFYKKYRFPKQWDYHRRNQITLLRVIPTMTFYLTFPFWRSIWHIFWYLFWQSAWHIFWNFCWHILSSDILSGISFAILSGISSAILSGILSGVLSGISFAILSGYLLPFFLAYLLAVCLAYLLIFYLAYLLAFWHIISSDIFLAFYLAQLLAFFGIPSCISFFFVFWRCGWRMFWHSVWHSFWRLRPGNAHSDGESAKRMQRLRRRLRRCIVTKTNNPHLAGGEKYQKLGMTNKHQTSQQKTFLKKLSQRQRFFRHDGAFAFGQWSERVAGPGSLRGRRWHHVGRRWVGPLSDR